MSPPPKEEEEKKGYRNSRYCFLFFADYECYKEGSVFGYQYDQNTGNCSCKARWYGDKCQGRIIVII